MATDWGAVRLAYVGGTKTLREVAEDFGIKAAGVMGRAAREKWEADRKHASAQVSKAAESVIIDQRTDELAKSNEANIKLARAARAQVAKHFNAAGGDAAKLSASELNTLMQAVEKAQRIERLALGASTENNSTNMTLKEDNANAAANDFERLKKRHEQPKDNSQPSQK